MLEMVQTLSEANPFLLAFSLLIFDIPRYTLSLVSLALFGVWGKAQRAHLAADQFSVTVIIPTFNGGTGLHPTLVSLQRQTHRPVEIIVVDDGSTDDTRMTAERARALGLVTMVICYGTRFGRSAAINAARFASGDLIMTVDADTVLETTAIERLASVFWDPRVAGASGNIAIMNERGTQQTGRAGLCRRDHADIGAGNGQGQKGGYGLRTRRPALWRCQPADGGLSLRGQPRWRLRCAPHEGLHWHPAGCWILSLYPAGQGESRRQ